MTYSPILAVAEYLGRFFDDGPAARCGVARCGAFRVGQRGNHTVYGGMLPVRTGPGATVALTSIPGGEADPRQRYAEAYDNPAFIIHILGEDLTAIDRIALKIRAGADRTAHIDTSHGTINGISIGPARRTVRADRPRYEVQMNIDAEMIRGASEE